MKRLVATLVLSSAVVVSGADLESEARALEAMLIAPCCFSQQVSVHQSEASEEVRRDVRARLAAGQTRQDILDAYVAKYGKRILAEPPAEGFDVALYLVPLAMFGLSESEFFVGPGRVQRTRPDRGLRKLAEETGGGYFELKKTDELGPTFTRVAQELHALYTIGFTPTLLDNKEHKLEVRVKQAGMSARARKTYLASSERLSATP